MVIYSVILGGSCAKGTQKLSELFLQLLVSLKSHVKKQSHSCRICTWSV